MRVLHDRDIGFFSDLNHHAGDVVLPFRDDDGELNDVLFIKNGDGVMGGVGDEGGGFFRGLHGIVHCHFLVKLLTLSFDEGISFHFFELPLYFIFRHPEFFGMEEALHEEIGDGDNDVGDADVDGKGLEDGPDDGENTVDTGERAEEQGCYGIADNAVEEVPEKNHFEDGFYELDEIFFREDLFKALDRVDFFNIGFKGFKC